MPSLPHHVDPVELFDRSGPCRRCGEPGTVEGYEVLGRFRRDVYTCLDARADALFELADAVLWAAGRCGAR